MSGGCVLQAQVHACVISSLCMQISTEDGHGDGGSKMEGERGGTCAGNGQIEKEEEKDGVMTEPQARCLYMNLQAN